MSRTALQRLLKHVHAAVFDKSAHGELALRISHVDGAAWSIADEVMSVRAGAGPVQTFDLSQLNIGQLGQQLTAAGFTVPPISSAWSYRSAMTLAESSGNSGESNGDRVEAFTSLLWVLLSGYAPEIREAERQVGEALRQMIIPQAEGDWLDLWASLYGVARLQDESDAALAVRIPREAFRLRVNAHGIEQAIFDQTGSDVRIEEPWRNIFRLDESLLSGEHKFYDGARIGYHLIQPTSLQQVDWEVVLAIIERNRPAGVEVLSPLVRRMGYVDASEGGAIHFAGTREHCHNELYLDRPLLDFNLVLSDNDAIILNRESRHRREILRTSHVIFDDMGFPDAYEVHIKHVRDYRTHYLDVHYRSQIWANGRSWASAKNSWAGLTTIIDSKHTRGELSVLDGSWSLDGSRSLNGMDEL